MKEVLKVIKKMNLLQRITMYMILLFGFITLVIFISTLITTIINNLMQ
jgi:hypothetical protein